MKYLLPALCMLIPITGWASIFVYPSKIDVNLSCKIADDKIKEIENMYSDSEAGESGVAKALPVDLNSDHVCEIYIDNPYMYEGNGNSFTTVLMLNKGKYYSIGDIQWNPDSWWYGEFANGYPRIFVSTYTGHRTNPINVTDVYYFNGKSYVIEIDSEFSHGRFMDLGLSAYKSKKYKLAEKYYLNAYRMNKKATITDGNNLAITWIKLGKVKEAENLLTNLVELNTNKKQLAAALFNLGKTAELQNNLTKALDYYEKAYSYRPIKTIKNKINFIKNLENKLIRPTVD